MSGGSGCQQIKVFVFKPGCRTLSSSVSLPVTLCFSFYLSPSTLGPFFSPLVLFLCVCLLSSNNLHWTTELKFFLSPSAFRLSPLLFLLSVLMIPFMGIGLCWWSLCVDTCLHLAAWWRLSLLMKLVRVGACYMFLSACVCVCLLCVVQHDETGLCWWSFSWSLCRPLLITRGETNMLLRR